MSSRGALCFGILVSVLVPFFRFLPCISPGYNRSCWSIVLFLPSLSLASSLSDSEGKLFQCELQVRGACDPLPCPFCNHCGFRLSIRVSNVVPSGPDLWKFNDSILEEDGYCQLIREFWADCRYRRPSHGLVRVGKV